MSGAAVVTLIGDHDLSMKLALLQALADIRDVGNLIVDLRPCTFVDSTIIAALLTAFRSHPLRGQRVSLVAPADTSYVMRALSVLGLGDVLPIHDSIERALERPS